MQGALVICGLHCLYAVFKWNSAKSGLFGHTVLWQNVSTAKLRELHLVLSELFSWIRKEKIKIVLLRLICFSTNHPCLVFKLWISSVDWCEIVRENRTAVSTTKHKTITRRFIDNIRWVFSNILNVWEFHIWRHEVELIFLYISVQYLCVEFSQLTCYHLENTIFCL